MPLPNIIAIDGPAGSGKSTLGKKVADELGYLFLDTGVMYRAVTYLALQLRVNISDEATITALAERSTIDVQPPTIQDGRYFDISINNQDVTWEIRQVEVDAHVSPVSAYPGVRRALTAQQQRIGRRGKVVMVGRDIGTVVMPDADLKIYLDASVEERARRRYLELIQRGVSPSLEDIRNAIRYRDQIDSTRQVAPLRPAEDAVIVNSDHLNIEQVFALVMKLVQEHQSK